MGVTENYLFSPIMELFSYTWGSRGNFGFINPIIPMGLKRENLEVLLNGSRLTNFQKNLRYLFYVRNIFK